MISPVKKIRDHMLITQEQLAKELGVCRQMIWKYERSVSVPRFEIIKKLILMAKNNGIEIETNDFFVHDK